MFLNYTKQRKIFQVVIRWLTMQGGHLAKNSPAGWSCDTEICQDNSSDFSEIAKMRICIVQMSIGSQRFAPVLACRRSAEVSNPEDQLLPTAVPVDVH
jgi:hypothetical protein